MGQVVPEKMPLPPSPLRWERGPIHTISISNYFESKTLDGCQQAFNSRAVMKKGLGFRASTCLTAACSEFFRNWY